MLSGKEVYMKKSPSYLNSFPGVVILDGNEVSYNRIELSNGDTFYFKNLSNCEEMARGVLKVKPENSEVHINMKEMPSYLKSNPKNMEKLRLAMNEENIRDRKNDVGKYQLDLGRGQTLTLTFDHRMGVYGDGTLERKSAELFGSDVQKVIDSDPAVKNKYFGGNTEFI